MRYWSPWDDQLLRVLRGEFRDSAPSLTFAHSAEGGVAVFHEQAEIGLWVAAGRLAYRYLPANGAPAMEEACDIMDIVRVSRALFADMLDPAS